MRLAVTTARALGHPRVGSEHLLLALAVPLTRGDASEAATVAVVLARHGATAAALRAATQAAAPSGAGASADRALVAVLGVDLDRLLQNPDAAMWDRSVNRKPVFPLGAGAARRRCARMSPPLGADAQASYEASLRLALARRERQHASEHLALTLVSLDPGVDWMLTAVGADRGAVLADLAGAFPPPARNPLLRAERRLGQRPRHRDIVRRYQRLTGRTAIDASTVAGLIAG